MSSIRDFIPICKLGQGSYSTVYKVKRITDQCIYALKKVKITKLSTKEKENALNEIRLLASLECKSIVGYKQAFFDDTINVLCIVMEFADAGDLSHLISSHKKQQTPIAQNEIWKVVGCMLTGLNALHSRGIMHRDIKCANIFKTKEGYKLGDLNVSKVVGGNLAYTQTGTPYYASPEVWRDQPYDSKSDIWSLGCIAFEMAALRPPFDGKSMEDLYRNIQNRPIPNVPSSYSQQLSEFIKLSMKKRPRQRPNANEFLQHPVFRKKMGFAATQASGVPLNSGKQPLLKTIKLPTDLSKLKEKLPDAKYQSPFQNNSELLVGNKVTVMDSRPKTPKSSGKGNKSEVFTNPTTPTHSNQPSQHNDGPSSCIKLGQQGPSSNSKLEQRSSRPYSSERKTNKVESGNRRNYDRYYNINNYYPEKLYQRPMSQNSLPRTEKPRSREKLDRPVLQLASQKYLQNDIDEIRKRLVKKCRVLSNHPRPSWWA